jgi:hypothetical protein
MKRGTYIGLIQHLIGQGALLRDPGVPGKVVAQFDNRTLRRTTPELLDFEGQMKLIDDAPADALGFGWHVFDAKEFAFDEPAAQEEWRDPHAMPMRSDRSHLTA